MNGLRNTRVCGWHRLRCGLVATGLALLAACGGGGGGGGGESPELPSVDTRAVAAADPGSPLPEGWQHGAFMEIYVRGYQDSDGDGKGDLRGLIQRLDYLKALGVSGLWLMPVTRSQDHDHGYAVTDYRDIEPDYGSLADFDELLRQAHARGIGIIIDHVMNHSAAQHPAFLHAASARSDAFRDWYIWQDTRPAGWSIYGGDPWHGTSTGSYFAAFWDQMPDFNLKNPAVLAWHHDHLRFWLNRGVDGFRFDAVGNLVENGPLAWNNQPESLAVMGTVSQLLAGYSRRFMVCEAPTAAAAFAQPSACGGAFAFGSQSHLVGAVQGSARELSYLADDYANTPAGLALFASNHDSFAGARLWDQLGGDEAKLRLAAASYLLQRGTPFIYYGEEIGMAGAGSLSGDAALRTPMSWTAEARAAGFSSSTPFRSLSANAATRNAAAQLADPGSLLNHYKTLLALRQSQPVLAQGDYVSARSSGLVLALHRRLGSGAGAPEAVQLYNHGASPATATVSGLPPGASLHPWLPAGGADVVVDASGSATLSLPARSAWVAGVVVGVLR